MKLTNALMVLLAATTFIFHDAAGRVTGKARTQSWRVRPKHGFPLVVRHVASYRFVQSFDYVWRRWSSAPICF